MTSTIHHTDIQWRTIEGVYPPAALLTDHVGFQVDNRYFVYSKADQQLSSVDGTFRKFKSSGLAAYTWLRRQNKKSTVQIFALKEIAS